MSGRSPAHEPRPSTTGPDQKAQIRATAWKGRVTPNPSVPSDLVVLARRSTDANWWNRRIVENAHGVPVGKDTSPRFDDRHRTVPRDDLEHRRRSRRRG